MGPVEILILVAIAAVPLVALLSVARNGRHTLPETFASLHGVALTSANRPLIARYLERSYRWRMTGALLGAIIPFGTQIPGLEMVGGYLVGVLAAELTEARANRGEVASASLAPRTLTNYLPRALVNVLRAVPVVGLVAAGAFYALPQRESFIDGAQQYLVIILAGVILAVAICVEAMLRAIVRKPQPATTQDVLEADDAIRSASIHASAGAGIAALLLLLGSQFFGVAVQSDVQVVRWVAPALAAACVPVAFVLWARLGHDTLWKVRRGADAEARA